MAVGAASGRYPERTQVNKPAVVIRSAATIPAFMAQAFRAADFCKSADVAVPGTVHCARRASVEMPAVAVAAGVTVEGHRAGRQPGGNRQRCGGRKKSLSHRIFSVLGQAWPNGR